MMTTEDVRSIMYEEGRRQALDLQALAPGMTGTELNAAEKYIPYFKRAVEVKNMLNRPAGRTTGFICKSSAGRVVRLIQNYDSSVYTNEPEELLAQWGFVWSTDPQKAKPYIKSAESPYHTGECCIENDSVYKSTADNNVFSPSEYPEWWTYIGSVAEVIGGE